MPSIESYQKLSDLDLFQELERVDEALATANQMAVKWTQQYAKVKAEREIVQREIQVRRLNQKPEAVITELHMGTVFEGSVRGECFMMRVEGFSTDRQAVLLSGQTEDEVSAQGWAQCSTVKVDRVLEVQEVAA